MRIFPNNITEPVWRGHLTTYSPTLFDYQQEYSSLVPPSSDTVSPESIYVCPLCIKNYFSVVNDEVNGNSEFSLDHLPPESVGGRFKVITCKRCNNESGVDEAELMTLLNFGTVPDKRTNSLFPYTYVINKKTGEKFRGFVSAADGQVNIAFNENAKQYNKELNSFLKAMHAGQAPNLQLFVGSPNLEKIERALLKSAYLACFVWWGYEFVYSKNAARLRQVLKRELSYPTRIPTVWHDTKNGPLPKGISILSKDGVKEAFLVNLELKSNTENFIASILIPGPTDTAWQKLVELDKYVRAKSLTAFQCLTIPRTLTERGYTAAWNIFKDK